MTTSGTQRSSISSMRWTAEAAGWLRMPAVLLSPRSVFFALREDEGEDVSARSEPLLFVIWLAGMAESGWIPEMTQTGHRGLAARVYSFVLS